MITAKQQWETEADNLPDSIKAIIEEEAVKAFTVNKPNAWTPHYVTRTVIGQADIMALSVYAKRMLDKHRPS
jgi:hypothetical protein